MTGNATTSPQVISLYPNGTPETGITWTMYGNDKNHKTHNLEQFTCSNVQTSEDENADKSRCAPEWIIALLVSFCSKTVSSLCVCVRVCVRACVRVCLCACSACVYTYIYIHTYIHTYIHIASIVAYPPARELAL